MHLLGLYGPEDGVYNGINPIAIARIAHGDVSSATTDRPRFEPCQREDFQVGNA